jgi:hypothetical protein
MSDVVGDGFVNWSGKAAEKLADVSPTQNRPPHCAQKRTPHARGAPAITLIWSFHFGFHSQIIGVFFRLKKLRFEHAARRIDPIKFSGLASSNPVATVQPQFSSFFP